MNRFYILQPTTSGIGLVMQPREYSTDTSAAVLSQFVLSSKVLVPDSKGCITITESGRNSCTTSYPTVNAVAATQLDKIQNDSTTTRHIMLLWQTISSTQMLSFDLDAAASKTVNVDLAAGGQDLAILLVF